MKQLLDRNTYRKIKQMDKDTMQGLIQDIYESGKRDAESYAVDYDALRADLAKISGIGEKRLNEIMAVIDRHISKSQTDEQEEANENTDPAAR
ncbi:MAG: hypothetical protein IJV58_05190 [Oscillospiraceae bacterium]|nr:hypothetical protein [Oscillospiraceae bacterium]